MKTNNTTLSNLTSQARKWKEMTEYNEHSEVLCQIALFFNFTDFAAYFYRLSIEDYLTPEDSRERYEKRNLMLDKIESTYGTNIRNFVYNCL